MPHRECDVLLFQRQATAKLRQSNLLSKLFNAEVIPKIMEVLLSLRPPFVVFLKHTWDTFQVCIEVRSQDRTKLLVFAPDALYG